MSLTRIIAVVVDTTALTAYLPDGKSIGVLQGDPRVKKLLEAMPAIEANGFADVDLTLDNPYKDFEQQIGGAIRFFRVLRTKLNEVFDEMEKVAPLFDPETTDNVPVQSVGTVPQAAPASAADTAAPVDAEPTQPAAPVLTDEKKQAAVDEIMRNAVPASSPNFDTTISSEDTVVAVTSDNTIIPNQEKLAGHLDYSSKLKDTKGMQAFYARIAPVIGQRKHSVEDLLRFMEKNDLPIADDGCLIVYKVLKKRNETYFDCHTGKVPQHIGSQVCVDEKLIDLNRRNECSAGLHVARRGYIAGFGGDVCTLVKVAPEDVYTVPHGDPNKVRVRAYHILFELDQEAWSKLRNNVPMTSNPNAQHLLGRAVAGDHSPITEIVKINGHLGENIKVTQVGNAVQKDPAANVEGKKALDDPSLAKEKGMMLDKVQIEDLETKVQERAAAATNGRQAQALKLLEVFQSTTDTSHRKLAAQELLTFKRQAKVSWDKLGISQSNVELLLEAATAETPTTLPAPTDVPAAVEASAETSEPVTEVEPDTAPAPVPANEGRQEKAARLLKVVKAKKGGKREAAVELLALKKSSKVSWERLGLTQADVDLVTKAAG
jgi:hypothetical protein